MTPELLPIKFQEHLQLQALGINATSIGFNTLTFESDRFICVREKVGEQNQVVIIDMNEPENLARRPITADSAIMNPDSKIIALKAGRQVQIFDLEKKAKLKSFMMVEDILFWRWLGPATIGMVTESAVFHWSLEGTEDPKKVFDRHSSLTGCQIISYRTDSTGRWLLLIGIIAQHGRVVGAMQLYNVDRAVSQAIEGHAGTFAEIMLDGAQYPTKLFVFAVRSQSNAKLHLVEIDHREGNPTFPKKSIDIDFPAEAATDFPVSMQVGTKYDVVYMVTKFGFIQIFDLVTGICIFSNRISSETVFVTAEWREQSGIMGVNRKGQVLSVVIDEQNIVPYLLQENQSDLAVRLAYKNDLPGADDLFSQRFLQLISAGQYPEAARLAARSPRGLLRTPQTIETLKSVAVSPGQSSPLLQYFSILLEKGALNRHESLELAKPVLAQNKKALLDKWLKEDKLDCSEDLGDLVKPFDATLALSIYLRADVSDKVCTCFAELGQFSKLVLYSKKVGIQPDYANLLQSAMSTDPVKAVEFGKMLLEDHSLGVDPEMIFDLFVSFGLVQQAISSVLDRLKTNTDDVASLQTKVLRTALQQAPQIADAIFQAQLFSRYDHNEIASLCESTGLYQRAIEHYSHSADITRVLLNSAEINVEWTVDFLGKLPIEEVVAILRSLVAQNPQKFTPLAISAGVKLSDKLSPSFIMEIFEDSGNNEALFAYTGQLMQKSTDAKVHFAFIKAAASTGHYQELEKACKESTSYDPATVWNFLKEEGLEDQLPLIIVADRFNFVHDLVMHLVQKNMINFVEVYVKKVNPQRLPEVVAALLDCGCDGNTIQTLIASVPPRFPLDTLVTVLEERDQLPLLLPFLEQKIKQENSRDVAVFNSMAKILVVNKQNPIQFLVENNVYNTLEIAKFCEKRDHHLALVAYEKGKHDKELIRMTTEGGLFKEQAKYLLSRRDLGLWKSVLDTGNARRSDLLDQLNVAVIECQNAEDISVAVKALIAADLGKELLGMLEKILYSDASFASNKNLQNLLLLTAIKSRPESVMDHMNRLENYDGTEIAKACINAGLFEEAFYGYKRSNNMGMAMTTLVENIKDFDRAQSFAEDCNNVEVWSKLGRGLRLAGKVPKAIDAYIRADDFSDYAEVIKAASNGKYFEDLLRYLQVTRKKNRDPLVENELLFTLANLNRIADIEEFMQRPHGAQIQIVADKCYEAKLFDAAKILYSSISNFARLSTTLIHLKDFNAAVECAKRANSLRVWADVNQACLETGEYHLAQVCGLHLVVNPDELSNLIYSYESQGLYDQCMALLEASLGQERAHSTLYTELAIQYARHKPSKLLDYLKVYGNKANIQKIITVCQDLRFWGPMVHLLIETEDNERAIQVMIQHAEGWEHERMCKAIQKISSMDTIVKAVKFYLDESPLKVNELLTIVGSRVDPTRIVSLFKERSLIPLIKGYLISVQLGHNTLVNNTLNELLMEEEDLEGLRVSIAKSDKFDTATLAKRLEAHHLTEFRRLAAQLYRHNKLWRDGVALLIKEGSYKDAIALAAESRDRSVSEGLLRHIASLKLPILFLGCCYACADSLYPDVIVECAWRNGWNSLVVPFVCQSMREQSERMNEGINSRSASRISFN